MVMDSCAPRISVSIRLMLRSWLSIARPSSLHVHVPLYTQMMKINDNKKYENIIRNMT